MKHSSHYADVFGHGEHVIGADVEMDNCDDILVNDDLQRWMLEVVVEEVPEC